MLAASGELNRELGGIPCRPIINQEAALQPRMVMGTFAAAWQPNPLPEDRNRRSIYTLKLRGLADPLLEVFNSPSPDFSCERREASTVTPQVFALFNGQNSQIRALSLALAVIDSTADDRAAITECFRRLYGRIPSAEELQLCQQHWRQLESILDEQAPVVEMPNEGSAGSSGREHRRAFLVRRDPVLQRATSYPITIRPRPRVMPARWPIFVSL